MASKFLKGRQPGVIWAFVLKSRQPKLLKDHKFFIRQPMLALVTPTARTRQGQNYNYAPIFVQGFFFKVFYL